ncbi:MAG: hypothetical protein DKT66_24675 [Candidatus Melainabacteria bacterium]|nr:MAG: hypothetical protein DKT66_24675 [Candidatus Melainabacteria bacterium]
MTDAPSFSSKSFQNSFHGNKEFPTYNFLLCDFFQGVAGKSAANLQKKYGAAYASKILHNPDTSKRIRVFLCGKEVGHRHFDLRARLQKLMNSRMGCETFLGEDLNLELARPKVNKDFLSVEVDEAERADLIVLFLESFGTAAELTAFVMNRKTVSKLVVLNEKKYQNAGGFLNEGPLKLLEKIEPGRISYYETNATTGRKLPIQILRCIDRAVAKTWFDKQFENGCSIKNFNLDFNEFVALTSAYVFFPIEKMTLAPWLNQVLGINYGSSIVSKLTKRRLLDEHESFCVPKHPLRAAFSTLPMHMLTSIGKIRAQVLNQLIIQPSFKANCDRVELEFRKLF